MRSKVYPVLLESLSLGWCPRRHSAWRPWKVEIQVASSCSHSCRSPGIWMVILAVFLSAYSRLSVLLSASVLGVLRTYYSRWQWGWGQHPFYAGSESLVPYPGHHFSKCVDWGSTPFFFGLISAVEKFPGCYFSPLVVEKAQFSDRIFFCHLFPEILW